MSYIGQGDTPVCLIVPIHQCDLYQGIDGQIWTEIYIPPESIANYPNPWGSMLVREHQVRRTALPDYNLILDLNDNAKIKNILKHPDWTWQPLETITPKEILARYLKWYAVTQLRRHQQPTPNLPSIQYLQHYQQSHQDLLYYISQRLQ